MNEFTITFNTDNAAFEDDNNGAAEIERILNTITEAVKNGVYSGTISDIDGNSIGNWCG